MMNQMFYGREPHARDTPFACWFQLGLFNQPTVFFAYKKPAPAPTSEHAVCVCEPTPKYSPLRKPTVVEAERDIVKVEQWEMQASVCRAGRILRILSTSPNSLIFQLWMKNGHIEVLGD